MRVAVIATIFVALAGCGAQQAAFNSAGVPAAGAAGARGTHARTWMRADAKSSDLVYTSDFEGNVYVYTLPALTFVGELAALGANTVNLCSDAKGHVFVPVQNGGSGEVLEFEHAGTTPIATISDTYEPLSCAVDPSSGDLALANEEPGYASDIAIYHRLKGTPKFFRDSDIAGYFSLGYDDAGNLFTVGNDSRETRHLLSLPKGAKALTEISVNAGLRLSYAVQWDGEYMTIARMPFRRGTARIYRLQTTGSSATVVGTTKLSSLTKRFGGQTAIAGKMVVQPYSRRTDRLGIWPYPQGKAMSASVDVGAYINGVAVSFAKHDRRARIHTPIAGGQAQPTHPAI